MRRLHYLVLFACAATAALGGCSKAPAQKEEGGLRISGKIEIDPKLAKKTKADDVIYLIAKGAGGGMTVAVQKFTGNNYPYSFTLSNKDLMMPDQPVSGPLNLNVRVDKDGDAMTKTPGDLVGVCAKNPVGVQETEALITVNEVLK